MSVYRHIITTVCAGIVSLGSYTALAADYPKVITTPVPAPKEQIVEPEGYISCVSIPAGWYNNRWMPEYRKCRYNATDTRFKGEAYVTGHWECTAFKASNGTGNGECTNWEWISGYWLKTYDEK